MTSSQSIETTTRRPGTAPTRAAIVGTGLIGAVHREALRAIGVDVCGVVGSRQERSAAAALDWGVPDALLDFERVLDADIEVVHVCTPNATHLDYALRAVAAGKHVVVEKPVGVSGLEALTLEAAARAAGVVVTVPFVYRFHPVVREIRARRSAGELGRIHTVHGSYLQDWLLSAQATNWRVDVRAGGASRAFADIGSHWCDLVEWVAGVRFTELTAATAIGVRHRPDHASVSTEDTAMAVLRGPHTLGSVTVSQLAAGRKNRLWFELDGTVGSAAFDQENPEYAWFGEATGQRIFTRDPANGSAEQRRLATLPAGHAQGYAHCFRAFLADSYAAMAGAAPEGLPTISDGVRSARIVDAVLASAASGAWTRIDA